MRLSIIGPGRLGSSLAFLLNRVGHEVELLRTETPRRAIVLLTVPDAAIAQVAQTVPTGRIVLHCSGTTDWQVLRPHRPAGSWHPLMTFPGPAIGIPDLAGVPAAIAGDPLAIEVAEQLAIDLKMRAIQVPGDRRLYHAAAVMAGNFATVLLAEASKTLAAAGIDAAHAPALLAPLALQSIRNAAARGPAHTLTGPVARGDDVTMQAHRAALKEAGLGELVPLHEMLTAHAIELLQSTQSEIPIATADPGANVESGT